MLHHVEDPTVKTSNEWCNMGFHFIAVCKLLPSPLFQSPQPYPQMMSKSRAIVTSITVSFFLVDIFIFSKCLLFLIFAILETLRSLFPG